MRLIGQVKNRSQARTFSDYLHVRGIENEIGSDDDGRWEVWVFSEDQVETAKELLARYLENPGGAEYQQASREARARAAREKKSRPRGEIIHVRRQWDLGRYERAGYLTLTLIVLCVVLAFASGLGARRDSLHRFFITDFQEVGNHIVWRPGLPEIRQGQVWRLFTPMLIHFGFLHLLFNMLWLRDLGSMIERRQSVWLLAAQVLVISAASNLAQYADGGPAFGGMSGVVYGLLGYVWIRGKFDPGSGLYLNKTTVMMMIVWFVLCMTGAMGNIANTAHAVGLGIGTAWGYLSSGHLKRLLRRKAR